jgi:glycosyltransferase involved in cell wall biosynthesis
VLYVHRTQGRGVEGVHVAGTVDSLRALGFTVDVIAPLAHTEAAAPRDTERSADPRSRLAGWLSRFTPELLFELVEIAYNVVGRRRLEQAQATNVAFVYERYAIFAWFASRWAQRRRVRHVLEVNYTAMSPLVRKRSRLLRPLAIRCDRFVLRHAAVVIAVSTQLCDHLVRDYGVEARRILVIPNAADPAAFDPATPSLEKLNGVTLHDRQVIGFVGTFSPWHGLDLLVQSFLEVAARARDAVILLVGDGPERQRIERIARESPLAPRFVFAGAVPHRQLPQVVASFTVGVLPHSNDYGSPMKIFEYMAMGKAVVAPAVGPVRDVIEDGVNGVLFRPGDARHLGERLIWALQNGARLKAIGDAGRHTIETEHNWRRHTELVVAAVQATPLPAAAH